MYKVLFITTFILIASQSFAQRYIKQYPTGQLGGTAVDFCDANNGMVVSPTMSARTTDGGVTWSYSNYNNTASYSLAVGSPVSALRFNGTKGERTINGGQVWSSSVPVVTGVAISFSQVSMFRTSVGVVFGKSSATTNGGRPLIFRTVDSGATWSNPAAISSAEQMSLTINPCISMGSAEVGAACYVSYAPLVQTPPYVIVLHTSDSGKTWLQGILDTSLGLGKASTASSIQMVNATVGYMAFRLNGVKNYIVKTTDGGLNWARCDVMNNLPSNGIISFMNAQKGALLDTTTQSLFLTSDGGVTWVKKTLLPSIAATAIKYVSDNAIILVGSHIARTTDAGTTWISNDAYVDGGSSNSLTSIAFSRSGVGVATDFGKAIARTTNKGNTWYNVSIPASEALKFTDVEFASDSIVVAVADSGKFIRSTDAGLSWKIDSLPFQSKRMVLDASFSYGTGYGMAVLDQSRIVRTTNYGATWDSIPSPTTKLIRNILVHKSDSTYTYICGDSALVMYSANNGATWKSINTGLTAIASVRNISTVSDKVFYAGVNDSITTPGTKSKEFRYWKADPRWSQGAETGSSAVISSSQAVSDSVAFFGKSSGYIYRTTNSYKWDLEQNLYPGAINVIRAVSPYEIYFTRNDSIYKRIQGDYSKPPGVITMGAVACKPVKKTKDTTVTITNTGTDTLRFSTVSLSLNTNFTLKTPILTVVPPGATAVQTISFSPDTTQSYQDTLRLVSDALLCPTSKIILNGSGIVLVSITGSSSICKGGNAVLSAIGGTGSKYLWNTGDSTQTITVNPSATTTYSVTAVDNNGYTSRDSIVVTVNPVPVANAGADVSMCYGDSTRLTASGGVTYSWSPAAGLSNPNVSNPYAHPASATSYVVVVTNSQGCSARDTVVVTVYPAPVANAGPDLSMCYGGAIQLHASGGAMYSWSPATGLSDSTVAEPIAHPEKTTTYIVAVRNTLSCKTSTDTIVVRVDTVAITTTRKSIDYGKLLCDDSSRTQSVKVKNTGRSSSIVYRSIAGSGATSYNVTPVSATIAGGDSVTFSVEFRPGSDGVYDATVSFTSAQCGIFDTTHVLGEKNSNVAITSRDSVVAFDTLHCPAQGGYRDSVIRIKNTGSLAVRIDSATIIGNGFSILSPAGTVDIAPGRDTAYKIRFTPGEAGKNYSGTFAVYASPCHIGVSIQLAGRKDSTGLLATPQRLEFDTIDCGGASGPKDLSIIVTNRGSESATLAVANVTGIPFHLLSPTTPVTLVPGGGSQEFKIRFDPPIQGSYDGNFTVSTSPCGLSIQRTLHGVCQFSSGVAQEARTPAATIELEQNYPNPFSQLSVVSCQLSVERPRGTFEIWDMLGRVVYQTNIDQNLSQITIDAREMTNGLYIYTLSDGIHVLVRKMTVMK